MPAERLQPAVLVALMHRVDGRKIGRRRRHRRPSPYARTLLFGYVASSSTRRLPHRDGGRPAVRSTRTARRAARPSRLREPSTRRPGRGRGAAPAHQRGPPGPRRRGTRRPGAAPRSADDRGGPAAHASADVAGLAAHPGRDPPVVRVADRPVRSDGPLSRRRRLRDGLGVPSLQRPPRRLTDPVDDPLADLAGRPLRPPTAPSRPRRSPSRLGLGAPSCAHAPAVAAAGRVLDGEFRPAGSGTEIVRRRSAAPAEARRWRGSARRSSPSSQPRSPASSVPRLASRRGPGAGCAGSTGPVDGVTTSSQLRGARLGPETLLLGARDTPTTSRRYLDELTSSGEVLWGRARRVPGSDELVPLQPVPTRRRSPCHPRTVDALQEVPPGAARRPEPGGPGSSRRARRQYVSRAVGRDGRRTPSPLRCGPRLGPPRRQRHPDPAARARRFGGAAHASRGARPAAARAGTRADAGPLRSPRDGQSFDSPPESIPIQPGRAQRRRRAVADRHGLVTEAPLRARMPGGLRRGLQVLALRGLHDADATTSSTVSGRPVRHRRRHQPAAHLR